MRNNLRATQPKIRALAIYQTAGGIIGLGVTIYLIATTSTVTGLFLLIFLLALGLFSYSIYCGVTLIKTPVKGLKLSKIN